MEDNTPFYYDLDPCFVDGAPEIEDIHLVVDMDICLGVSFHGKPYYLCRRERALSDSCAVDYPYMSFPKPDHIAVKWMDLYTESHRNSLEEAFIAQALDE